MAFYRSQLEALDRLYIYAKWIGLNLPLAGKIPPGNKTAGFNFRPGISTCLENLGATGYEVPREWHRVIHLAREIDSDRAPSAELRLSALETMSEIELESVRLKGLTRYEAQSSSPAEQKKAAEVISAIEGEWSLPMTKTNMMNALKLSQKQFNSFIKQHPHRKVNRQLFEIRVDAMTPAARKKLGQ